jgi:hypothetical protein
MVMAGVTIVAIAVVAIVASDDHYRGVGPVSPVVGLRAVVRIVVATIVAAVATVATVVWGILGVRRGCCRPDKSAREEAGGHWQKPRLSRSRFGSCQDSSAQYRRSAERH